MRGDTLRSPAFFAGDRLADIRLRDRQSAVLAREWGEDAVGNAIPGAAISPGMPPTS